MTVYVFFGPTHFAGLSLYLAGLDRVVELSANEILPSAWAFSLLSLFIPLLNCFLVFLAVRLVDSRLSTNLTFPFGDFPQLPPALACEGMAKWACFSHARECDSFPHKCQEGAK